MTMKVLRFTVDEAWARANNELLRDTRRLQASSVLLGLCCLAAGLLGWWLLRGGHASFLALAFGVVAAVLGALMAVVIPRKVGGAQELYDRYPLAPAVIAAVNPRDLVLLALVNVTADPDAAPRWALATRTVTAIRGQERKVGTRVPAVAVSGRRNRHATGRWDEVTPMPIAWGTPDPDVVAAARRGVPAEQWRLLAENRDRWKDVQRTRYNLLEL